MQTFTAFTKLPSQDQAEALGEAMEELDPAPTGIGVFEIEDGSGTWEVGGYFTEQPDSVELALLASAYGAGDFVISEVPDTDWVDKVRRELTPVEAGRFFVYGSHDADKVPETSVPLLIEAAMAFGTGHHGTTLGCLKALDRLDAGGLRAKNVADIGCGTAVLAMAAAKIWEADVLASDIDEVAIEVAGANLRANGMDGEVACYVAPGFEHDNIRAAAPFDLVFANILKQPLIDLAPSMAANMTEAGHAILSGLLTRQAEDVVAAYAEAGFTEASREVIGDWVTLVLRKG
ncbi:50S ribosomal protein L11 methyltransferase [Allosediminivita pacifica]|uniref:Ribosomal protein L11 methyltransferase n=1 Tax=Allosediminivita pacifica TaxID=1267769 RepID=A0A2T6ANZ0_9RHOB|nr:50S ribosomal protein L11 methyltransferase [Allosediminivita pacifica]PTX45551.1 [LSU ribosomal protein L11P]-lysine N-methyltransferase [Allosediminivita pacifica]GGB20345.1 ribosomal protein L11 methyltransferase [Allosediminivita pacifica]